MLLEDDPSFREVIKDCLTENGYIIVPVQNGGEGVREVLAGDFAFVLCDMMMPGLRGDMFYRAVERIRPSLCQRFVFMSGHHNDARTNEFLKKVNGVVLRKPFPLKSLLDLIALAEVRRTFQSVFDQAPSERSPSQVRPPAADLPSGGTPHSQEPEIDEKVTQILARFKNLPAPAQPSPALEASESQPHTSGASRSFALAALTLFLVLIGGLWIHYSMARHHVAAISSELATLEAEWSAVSARLQEALEVQSKIEMTRSVSARIAAERAKPRWTPALRSVIPPGNAGIDILEVETHGQAEDSGVCEVRIRGVAGGSQPRWAADQYRRTIEENLKRNADGRAVSTSFELLNDIPGALPDQMQATFVVIATLGRPQAPPPISKEER